MRILLATAVAIAPLMAATGAMAEVVIMAFHANALGHFNDLPWKTKPRKPCGFAFIRMRRRRKMRARFR